MLIDLTTEEMNLIQECFIRPNLSLNRDAMIAFVNQTDVILKKFQAAVNPPKPEESTNDSNNQ